MKVWQVLVCVCLVVSSALAGEIKQLSSTTGFDIAAEYCFGEPTGIGGKDVGYVDIQLTHTGADFPQYPMYMLIYDDEDNSWGALTDSMSCQDKFQYAKDYKFLQSFNVTFDDDHVYNLHRFHVGGSFKRPHNWYFVLANCEGYDNIQFEMDVHNTGVYVDGTGPANCIGADEDDEDTGEIVGLAVTVCLLIVFSCAAIAYICKLKKGSGSNYGAPTTLDNPGPNW